MPHPICVQCGTQFAEQAVPPDGCAICQDLRQYVRWGGQAWTTLEELRGKHMARLELDHGLLGIESKPNFAIGQRALLVPDSAGNILWDCISLIDDAIVARLRAAGGLKAIAISHCHYYTTMIPWSEAFGDIPIYLHEKNRKWVTRPDRRVEYWSGESLALSPQSTLWRVPGHFSGGTVLHWTEGAEGKGALMSGDILQVAVDRRFVSFMYSYPNMIPVSPGTARRIGDIVEPLAFDRIYGAFWGRVVKRDAKAAVRASVERYVAAVTGPTAE
jgi:glyoxylase-like metal-dependent hydrolase (beta-lactamase superfamily II)